MEDIPYERAKGKQSHKNIMGIFVEIKIRNKRWLLSCFHNPSKNIILNYTLFL